MSGLELITFGCRLNLAESATMRAVAADQDDLIIVNSCAVTAEAARQARQAIRRAKRARPDARIVVTGCAAEIEPARFAAMPEVDRVIGNDRKFDISSFIDAAVPSAVEGRSAGLSVERPSTSLGTADCSHVAVATDRTRAFVGVQNGCDHRCTFCIIPYGRGASRSAPAGTVIERIKALVGDGVREVVLTGVDITSYGPDLPGSPSLGRLVERILRHVPDLPRLRLSSLDSVEIDDRLFELLAGEPRMMPHLHLSLQSGDDLILKRMKRRHSRAQAVEMVARLKSARPGIAIGADLIAGFPTEDEAMAARSLALVDDCDIVFAHVFPFSPRPGTPAARMPQVAPEVAKARAKALREAGARRKAAWLEGLVGSTQRVVIERDGVSGHAENFAKVRLKAHCAPAKAGAQSGSPLSRGHIQTVQPSEIVDVRITHVEGDTLVGLPA